MAKRRPAGDGMVRKREDGRWEGRIVVGHKKNGDSIFRYISAPTQKELSAKLRQLTEAYKGVDLTEESNMALSVWLDKWLDEYMAATLRPTTLNGYRRSLELHVKPYLGNKTLSKITAVDLRSLYRTLQETGRKRPTNCSTKLIRASPNFPRRIIEPAIINRGMHSNTWLTSLL